jgi:hypothetical protein
MFELSCTALNIDFANNRGVAAAWFTWVTLQAHGLMEGYLVDKFQ